MDIILIIKAFLIGLVWAGSFYLVIAYIFPIVPMPQLLYFRERLRLWTDDVSQRNERLGRRWWELSKGLFKVITGILWIAVLAAYAYFQIPVLQTYIEATNPYFWIYYAIAVILPTIILIRRGINIYRNAKRDSQPEELMEHEKGNVMQRLEALK